MMRVFRVGAIALVAAGLAGILVCCVNFGTRVEFSLDTSAGLTTLNVYVAQPGVVFNPHGGDADRYTFVFPAGREHIPAARIQGYVSDRKEALPPFVGSGGIDLKIDDGGCEIRVDLSGPDGRASPANGVHRMRYCGLHGV